MPLFFDLFGANLKRAKLGQAEYEGLIKRNCGRSLEGAGRIALAKPLQSFHFYSKSKQNFRKSLDIEEVFFLQNCILVTLETLVTLEIRFRNIKQIATFFLFNTLENNLWVWCQLQKKVKFTSPLSPTEVGRVFN